MTLQTILIENHDGDVESMEVAMIDAIHAIPNSPGAEVQKRALLVFAPPMIRWLADEVERNTPQVDLVVAISSVLPMLIQNVAGTIAREAEVIKSMALVANGFNCVVQTWISAIDDRRYARAVFQLNGRNMVSEVSLPGVKANPIDLAAALRDDMAEKIAMQILDGNLGEAFR